MSNDSSAFFPMSPDPVILDSVILEAKPFIKFVVGGAYNYAVDSCLNLQYFHGFIHEWGNEALYDYLFLRDAIEVTWYLSRSD